MELMITLSADISKEQIDNLLQEKVEVIRFNFSHIDYMKFIDLYSYIRENYSNVKILQDLQGQKIRVLKEYKYNTKIEKGKSVCFCNNEYYLKNLFKVPYILVPITWEYSFVSLFEQTKKILIGTTEFIKDRVEKDCLFCTAMSDCVIRGEKGINFVGIDRTIMTLTEKDKRDLEFIKKYPVDYICVSFVENINILQDLKNILKGFDYKPKIISKIETMNGVENLKKILVECDGIMLGRGDLSKEIDLHIFGKYQSEVINIMNCWSNKEFIIGTYILQNMIYTTTPTVSELTAIQYFKENNVSMLMLSDETLIGKHPLKCLKLLRQIF
jgi:pyruvate kinase